MSLAKLSLAALALACAAASANAAVIVRIDEAGIASPPNNLVGWAAGTPAGSAAIAIEESNTPATDIDPTDVSYLVGGSFGLAHPPISETISSPADIEASFDLNFSIGNGVVVARKFNILSEDSTLSDTLIVVFTGLASSTSVDYHFMSDSLSGGGISAYSGTPGVDLFTVYETGSNDSLNALAPGWLPAGISTGQLDIQFRSDVVPEPATAGILLLGGLAAVAGRRRRR